MNTVSHKLQEYTLEWCITKFNGLLTKMMIIIAPLCN